jgi:UDP-glucose-4-epimerase GalE
MQLSDKKYILVTGGAGYIGSHICKALSNSGYTPVTFDNLSTGHSAAVKWGDFVEGDLLNQTDLMKIFSRYKFLGVIHLAAKAYVGESTKKPLEYYEGNLSTTVNLLKVMREFKVDKVIFSSTCATYGEPDSEYISEDSVQNPINPYGHTKLFCEQMIKSCSEAYPLSYGILRYFNAAGADPDNEIGESHFPETHLIPLALKAALQNETFKVFGCNFQTRDGSAIRDYMHVSDIASAHLAALDKVLNGGQSFTCNIGSGIGHSVLEVMKQLSTIFPKFEYCVESRRPGDAASLVANIQSMRKLLDFSLLHSDLETIITTALRWETSEKFRNETPN